ncbi:MAG: GC-type dockerin domain-anchored protein [Phycisphaerales bacterium]
MPSTRFPEAAATVLAMAPAIALAQPLNTNLVVNGDAETGDVSGWIDGGLQPRETSVSGSLGVPDCLDIGAFCFTGRTGASVETLEQRIDVSARAAQIDAGELTSVFSILMQSRIVGGARDIARTELEFVDAGGMILESAGFEDAGASGVFDWSRSSDRRTPPAGTRTIVVRLVATRSSGSSTDAYFDLASLALTDECRPDVDGDGVLTIFDFLAYQNLFAAGDLGADFDGDCELTLFDFLAFQNAFDAGCP